MATPEMIAKGVSRPLKIKRALANKLAANADYIASIYNNGRSSMKNQATKFF